MVQYEIVPNHDGLGIRIFDAPANGWRTLFTKKNGSIVRYENLDEATASLRIYDSADKTALIEAELEVYLKLPLLAGRLATAACRRSFNLVKRLISSTPPST